MSSPIMSFYLTNNKVTILTHFDKDNNLIEIFFWCGKLVITINFHCLKKDHDDKLEVFFSMNVLYSNERVSP